MSLAATALATLLAASGCTERPSPENLLKDARTALKRSQYEKVRELVAQIPKDSETWQDGLLLTGEAATREQKFSEALDWYSKAAAKDPRSEAGLLALFSAAEIYLEIGRLSDAERLYREVLEVQPGNGITNDRMAFLLSLTGRRWKALRHYDVLIRSGESDYRELALAADVGRGLEQPEFLQKCLQQAPGEMLVRLAVAVQAFEEGNPEAVTLLKGFVEQNPQEDAAQVLLGELLLDADNDAEFLAWYQQLPENIRTLPEIWFVCGLWARSQGELKAAAECFWKTVSALPHHRRAVYMLGQTLVAQKDPQADAVTANSALLIELSQTVDQILVSEGQKSAAIQRAADILLQLGRIWEACAWAQYSIRTFPEAEWAQAVLMQHGRTLEKDLPMVTKILRPTQSETISESKLFDRLVEKQMALSNSASPSVSTGDGLSSGIRFRETSLIPFTYFNADDPATKGVRSFEQTGGGVAILDVDLDGAPDVFLAQGTEWISGKDHPETGSARKDALYRNRSGRRFEHCDSGLPDKDDGFGQGCSAGDFNNDGFADIYIANAGVNQLLQNMGDGTFADMTEEAGISQKAWTSSVMICDLNADGLPDLFDVNYLKGADVYKMICMGRACSPSVFPGERDVVLINRGDGTFTLAPDLTPQENSKGLGIVAFCDSPGSRPDLFIANDQVGNHFLRNLPADSPHRLQFEEASLITGLAFNEHGLPMACMGVAADDWDGNNLLDLFVTNFHNESNTMYLQDARGLFVDATNVGGLKAASVPFTGWGTQSLDANLDGKPDLVVTNGHVDDYRDVGGEYHMRPQFFVNRGGYFDEMFGAECGEWFDQKFLGRGLARVDWNLDGLPEFIVSNINTQVSVLVNETLPHGHFLNVRLISTDGARDAAGTFVTLEQNGKSTQKQLLMGDGYMASNERIVQFGLGVQDSVARLTIEWPSGMVSVFSNLPVNSEWTAVEGRDNLFRLPTP